MIQRSPVTLPEFQYSISSSRYESEKAPQIASSSLAFQFILLLSSSSSFSTFCCCCFFPYFSFPDSVSFLTCDSSNLQSLVIYVVFYFQNSLSIESLSESWSILSSESDSSSSLLSFNIGSLLVSCKYFQSSESSAQPLGRENKVTQTRTMESLISDSVFS